MALNMSRDPTPPEAPPSGQLPPETARPVVATLFVALAIGLLCAAVAFIALSVLAGEAGAQQRISPPGPPQTAAPSRERMAERGRLVAAGGAGQAGLAVSGTPQGSSGMACITCHGPQGQGDAAAGFPKLAGLDPRYLAKQLEDYASGARANEVMTPIAAALSAEDRRAVAVHYARMPRWREASPAQSDDPRERAYGASIYAQGLAEKGVQACSNCHGPAGIGRDPIYPRLSGQHASYMEAQLRLWREGVRSNDPGEVMRAITARLDERDMAAVSAYLASIGR